MSNATETLLEDMPVSAEMLQEMLESNEMLSESYSQMARAILAMEDEGWNLLNSFGQEGFSLQELKDIAEKIRESTLANPILSRGFSLRSANVFGKGFTVKPVEGGPAIPARVKTILEKPINRSVVNSAAAWTRNERALFTNGNFFLVYNRTAQTFMRIPLDQISDIASDPEDAEQLRYLQRTYMYNDNVASTGNKPVEKIEWIPVDTYDLPKGVQSLGGKKVRRDLVVIPMCVNTDDGQRLGTPDALAALPWAIMYREYLKDGSKILKALAAIAWVMKNKSPKGATNAGTAVANSARVASTMTVTDGVSMESMPKSNSVDLNTGRALASMAATAMEVSVVAVLSDPGTSGAYGTAKTLDAPTEQAAIARQNLWKELIIRIYRVLGVKTELLVEFPPISEDPEYRRIQSIRQAWETGLFQPEVIQATLARELDLPEPGDVPDGILLPNNKESLPRKDIDADAEGGDATAENGQGGQNVGKLADGNDKNEAAKDSTE